MGDQITDAIQINNNFQRRVSNLASTYKNVMEDTRSMINLHTPSGYSGLTIKVKIYHPGEETKEVIGYVNNSNIFLPITQSVDESKISKTVQVRFQTDKTTDKKQTLGNSLHILVDVDTDKPILLYKSDATVPVNTLMNPSTEFGSDTRQKATAMAGNNVFVNRAFQGGDAIHRGCGALPNNLNWKKAGENQKITNSWSVGQCKEIANRAGATNFMLGTEPWKLNVFDSNKQTSTTKITGTYECKNEGRGVKRNIDGKETGILLSQKYPFNNDDKLVEYKDLKLRSGGNILWPVFTKDKYYLGALWKNENGKYKKVSKWILMEDNCVPALKEVNCDKKSNAPIAKKTGSSPLGKYCGDNIFVLLTSSCYYTKEEVEPVRQSMLPILLPIKNARNKNPDAENFSLFEMPPQGVILGSDGMFYNNNILDTWSEQWQTWSYWWWGGEYDYDDNYSSEGWTWADPVTSVSNYKDYRVGYNIKLTCESGKEVPCSEYKNQSKHINDCPGWWQCLDGDGHSQQPGTTCGGSAEYPTYICKKDDDNNTWWDWYYGSRCVYEDESRCDHHSRIELTNEGQLRAIKTSSGSQLWATAPLPPDVVEKIEPYPEWENENGDFYGNRPIIQYGPVPGPANFIESGITVYKGQYLLSENRKFRLLFGNNSPDRDVDEMWDKGFLYGFGVITENSRMDFLKKELEHGLEPEKYKHKHDKCKSKPMEPTNKLYLKTGGGYGNSNNVCLQYVTNVCGLRSEIKYDLKNKAYVLPENNTKRTYKLLTPEGNSINPIYPVAASIGSYYSNPDALNTALYRMIYVDEYSIPYVLGENDIDYKGDFVFMGYYVTNMEDKENCYECEPDAGTDITSAEIYIENKIIEREKNGKTYVGFEYDPSTRQVKLLDKSLYKRMRKKDTGYPVEFYEPNISLGKNTRLYLRKPLVSNDRLNHLCTSNVLEGSSQDIVTQAGGPYNNYSLEKLPENKRCDKLVDLDKVRSKYYERQDELNKEANILQQDVISLKKQRADIKFKQDKFAKEIDEDMNDYEYYYNKVLAIIKEGSIDAMIETSNLSLVDNNYRYIVWSILAITLLMFMMSFKKK